MKLQDEIILKIKKMKYEAFTISDILELSNYDNLRKTLERMVSNKLIRRLIRGVYDIPTYNSKFKMFSSPSIDGVAKAIARNFNWDISPTGNFALNLLGLSTQIPSKYIYVSSGPYRSFILNGIEIEFKHATSKETYSFSAITHLIIQGFKELGKENINDDIIRKIKGNLSDEQIILICSEGKHTTKWIYENILKLRR
jgi:hypothetical protein